jgi:inosine-uridine nucleoside N-ribohydrolase
MRTTPVILDTDIGTDIDDTWALAMLLRCPELDLKLVTTATGDTVYRAKLAARLLEVAGRPDVPVGIGVPGEMNPKHRTQEPWAAGYDLARYPGTVNEDGVAALIETIMGSRERVTLIAIGPLTNVAAALQREPRIAERARFVGMQGSVRWSHAQGNQQIAEYNVKMDVPACQKAFEAGWDKTITPLDTCARVVLAGAKYAAVAGSADPIARAIIENYEIWKKHGGRSCQEGASSVLYDCVAVYLAFAEALLEMRRLKLAVTDDGFTREDPTGREINVALAWKNLAAFEDLLVERITRKGRK